MYLKEQKLIYYKFSLLIYLHFILFLHITNTQYIKKIAQFVNIYIMIVADLTQN